MTPERWRRITDVFHAALARDSAGRGTLLDEACDGDPALRAEVDSMLAAHQDAGGFGEAPGLTASEDVEARLVPGAALGPYRIESLIGTGGMGEVYRARDTRLDRDVAVKVLPVRVATDARLRQRLRREAKALAALSHPHICSVFDVGQQDGVDYLVMEYLEGETLAHRLTRGGMPLDQALRCAIEIADALDKAHAQSVVHRDLKPNNVMLTKRGARLLDFGISKLRKPPLAGAADGVPTVGAPLTGEGHIVGTLQYMAPEQLHGQEADARTDIFAFGAVVYEMVTGRKAFEGKTQASVVAAILEHEPVAVSRLQPATPPGLDHLVRTCLAKDPDHRWQSAGDVGRYLTSLVETGSEPRTAVATGRRARRVPRIVAAGVGILVAALGVRWMTGARRGTPPPVLRSALPAPPGVVLQPQQGFALSPDGSQLAFIAQDAGGVAMLWVRPLASLQARPLAGTAGASQPFWSPDGRDIGFFADQKLKRIPRAGGVTRVLAEVPDSRGGAWGAGGRIVYGPDRRTGLFEVPEAGGEPRALTSLDAGRGELSHRFPRFLPEGRTLLFLVQTAEPGDKDDRSRIEALDANGARHEILKVNASAAFAHPGQLLFWQGGSLYAQELDPKRWRLHGEARLVAEGVALTGLEWAAFSVSEEGGLVYDHASRVVRRLEWRDRSGRLLSVAAPEGEYWSAALSPDGRQLAYVGENRTLKIRDLVRGTDARVSFEVVDHYSPVWAPQGDWMAYAANKADGLGGEIWRRPSSGSGGREVLYTSAKRVGDISWSPNGRWIAFQEGEDLVTDADLFVLDLVSRTVRARVTTPASDWSPRFSPDGRWLAYASNVSGRAEVYVVPALEGAGQWQVSTHGGYAPRWGYAGAELFFQGLDAELKVVKVDLGADPKFGLPEPLFVLAGSSGWDPVCEIGRDGRILVAVQLSPGASERFSLISNWPQLLEAPAR